MLHRQGVGHVDGQEGGGGYARALLGESVQRCTRVDVGRETTSGDGILLNVIVQVYLLDGVCRQLPGATP